jgi:hypothetical protein
MPEYPESDVSREELDLDRAEFATEPSPICASCSTPITDSYFTTGSNLLCERCHAALKEAKPAGSAPARMLGAFFLGGVAAIVAGGLWLLVTELTGYEIGLIAIVVGFLVGGAVRMGARHAGGLFYQLLAVFLTYSAIVMTYVPAIATEFENSEEFRESVIAGFEEAQLAAEERDAAESDLAAEVDEDGAADTAQTVALAAWAIAIPVAFAAPFLAGFENVIGILIIGFALWQAWRMNARPKIDLKGPFRLGAGGPALD